MIPRRRSFAFVMAALTCVALAAPPAAAGPKGPTGSIEGIAVTLTRDGCVFTVDSSWVRPDVTHVYLILLREHRGSTVPNTVLLETSTGQQSARHTWTASAAATTSKFTGYARTYAGDPATDGKLVGMGGSGRAINAACTTSAN